MGSNVGAGQEGMELAKQCDVCSYDIWIGSGEHEVDAKRESVWEPVWTLSAFVSMNPLSINFVG